MCRYLLVKKIFSMENIAVIFSGGSGTLLGENGEAYNVANEDTYISVRDMAEMVLDAFSPSNKVFVE